MATIILSNPNLKIQSSIADTNPVGAMPFGLRVDDAMECKFYDRFYCWYGSLNHQQG